MRRIPHSGALSRGMSRRNCFPMLAARRVDSRPAFLENDMGSNATARWIDKATQMLIGATAVVATIVALAGTGQRAFGAQPTDRYRVAMQAYEARQWTRAYEQLAAAADAGDASAARVAAMMARHGPALFGQRFEVSSQRLMRWDLAMRGRRPAGSDAAAGVAAAAFSASDASRDIQIAGAR